MRLIRLVSAKYIYINEEIKGILLFSGEGFGF